MMLLALAPLLLGIGQVILVLGLFRMVLVGK